MSALLIAFQFLPYILTAVTAVEQAMSNQPGATKKAMILSAIAAATQVGEQVPESHVKVISGLIDSVVASLNASGIFQHNTATPAK
jgi:hypothetical protein